MTWMSILQLFHQSKAETHSPLHVAPRHETSHMLSHTDFRNVKWMSWKAAPHMLLLEKTCVMV